MLSVAQALEIVLQNVKPLPPGAVALAQVPLGMVLAEDVVSDLDMPPFDKAMMDGYALRASDIATGHAELAVVEEITAGRAPTIDVQSGQASRIMTGAPVPAGADSVVMIERCELLPNGNVCVKEPNLKPGQHILSRGREMRLGETVLRAGARLRPQEFGLLAAVGHTVVRVHPAPRVAILSTGDELVDPTQTPGTGQIRNSNGPMLEAQVARAGGVPWFLGIARDEPGHLRALITEALQADVLILSGGVSAGKLDLVPEILQSLGVQALFHKVAMKPGKPILFGIKPSKEATEAPRLIFGLPGNPVSALVGFELFVRPALRGMMALQPGPSWVNAELAKDFPFRTDRPTYHPANLRLFNTGWIVEPVAWFGSPDLRAVTSANAFVLLPAGDQIHQVGSRFEVMRVEGE